MSILQKGKRRLEETVTCQKSPMQISSKADVLTPEPKLVTAKIMPETLGSLIMLNQNKYHGLGVLPLTLPLTGYYVNCFTLMKTFYTFL